jgi:hypothetical protein
VEVRRVMVAVVHRDHDPVEAADPRHSSIISTPADGERGGERGLAERAGARGLRGVYVLAVCGLRPPSRACRFVPAMRLRATRRDSLRHLINARNEGVPGSSPGVGSPRFCSGSRHSRLPRTGLAEAVRERNANSSQKSRLWRSFAAPGPHVEVCAYVRAPSGSPCPTLLASSEGGGQQV